jgi:hypothetical protein
MNVLVLTPDRVGSTLLQRVISVYMNNTTHENINQPVINLHELSNGIENYYSKKHQKLLIGKPQIWDYSQSLLDVIDILKHATHTVTSRLAHYHLLNRNDPLHHQLKLFEYLDENFFIISCKRESVFEYALSWGINAYSKQLNVYTHKDKFATYAKLRKDKIVIPKQNFINYLNAYKRYLNWIDTYFNVDKVFIYEQHMPNIEGFISNLDCFDKIPIPKWKDIFNINWQEWNKCHYLMSDISLTSNASLSESKMGVNSVVSTTVNQLPAKEQNFLHQHGPEYVKSILKINELVQDRTIVSGIPIKLQTLVEKKLMIENFNECAIIYNEWAIVNNFTPIKDTEEIINQAHKELSVWYSTIPSKQNLLNKF